MATGSVQSFLMWTQGVSQALFDDVIRHFSNLFEFPN